MYISHARNIPFHYSDIMMSAMPSQIIDASIVCSTVPSGVDQRNYQSSPSLAFVRGIHRLPVDSLHKGPLTRKIIPFDEVIMLELHLSDDTAWYLSNNTMTHLFLKVSTYLKYVYARSCTCYWLCQVCIQNQCQCSQERMSYI